MKIKLDNDVTDRTIMMKMRLDYYMIDHRSTVYATIGTELS